MIEFQKRYLEAVTEGDRQAAQTVLDEATKAGHSIGDIYIDVIQPTMRIIGRLWQENRLTVAEEHLATAITQSAMARLFERTFEWRDGRTPTLIAACAEEERHQIGLRMLCDLLELAGWDTRYLGASVPIESLVDIVVKANPAVVALSAAISPNIPRIRNAIQAIRAADLERQPVIAVGGRAFNEDPELAHRVGADMTAIDAVQAVEELSRRFAVQRA